MSAFGRGKRRWVALAGAVGAVAAALAASAASAGAPAAEPDQARRIPLLSPEAPASFLVASDASPLIATFNAAPAPREDAAGLSPFAEPRFDVSAVAATAPVVGAAEPKAPPAPASGPRRRPLRRNRPAPRTTRRR